MSSNLPSSFKPIQSEREEPDLALPSSFKPLQDFSGQIAARPPPLQELGRHIVRSGSRVGEALLGLPGDVLRTAGEGAELLEKGAGKIREKIGLKPLKEYRKTPSIPGSEELRSLTTKIFGEIVTPKNEKEKFIDDIVSDVAVLGVPFKGKIPFLRSIATAIAGNVSEKAAKELGIGEKGQVGAKIGTFFLAALSGKGGVKKYWKQQYKLADDAVPKRALMDSNKLDRQLSNLGTKLRKGGIETPSQKFVEKPLKDLQKLTRGGEISVEDAVAAKIKINELRSSLFEEVKGKGARKHARTKINDVASFLDEALAKYGKENPKFFEHYKNANEAYAGFHQSKKVGQWISRALPTGKLGKGGLLLAEALFKPATFLATIPAFAILKSGELLTRVFKNSTLRKFYGNLVKDAIKENKAGFVKNLRSMEKVIEKTEPDLFDELSQS